MGAATENMERLAAENDIEIEFATDVLHAINRDIAEHNYADRSLSGCTADVDGLRLANAVGVGFYLHRFRVCSRRLDPAIFRLPHRVLHLLNDVIEFDSGQAFGDRSLGDGHRHRRRNAAQVVNVR